ncbi:MAG: helix-turn-helix domain-containing protein [Candidatus Poseidoniaceae archaeon]|nr:helix-turn-helix domain-containing protein [Candidatus Poseidoniaceae archaeon]
MAPITIYTPLTGLGFGESMTETCDPVFSRVDDLISLLGKSKLLHILFILNTKQRALRFTEIKQRVDSSSTTVTRRLAELETNGLVTRVVHSTVPVSVEYELTQDAQNLAPTIQSMYDWVIERDAVQA